MSIEYFHAYHSYLDAMAPLNDEEVGRLFSACLLYSKTGEITELIGNEKFIFPAMRADIDKRKSSLHFVSGENHPNWKGGITPQNKRDRQSTAYKLWREAVFKRDFYTCQECGKRSGKLNAHHIVKFSKDKSLRYVVSNGLTLCEECHKAKHRKEKHGQG